MRLILALLLLVCGAANAQQSLNSLGAASALSKTDTIPFCQQAGGCGSGDSLKQATLPQLNTYLSAEQVNCTNTAASDPGLVATAIATGRNVHIIGTCNFTTASSAIQLTTQGQVVYGDSISKTVINVGTNVIPVGLFQCVMPPVITNGSGYNQFGPIVRDMRIVYHQNDSASRSALINFTPPFFFQDCYDFKLEDIRMEECMVCVDMRGQSGESVMRRLEIGTLSVGVWIDGSAAPVLMDDVQFQPFGAELYGTTNCIGSVVSPLCTLYQTSNVNITPETTSGTDGPIGLMVGRMDGVFITNTLFFIGQGAGFYDGACCTEKGQPNVFISNSAFDTYSGLTSTAGGSIATIRIATTHFGTQGQYGGGQQIGINITGNTHLTCDGCQFYRMGFNSIIALTAGSVTLTGGQMWDNGGNAAIEVEGTGVLNMHGVTLYGTGTSVGWVLVNHSSTGAVANISGVVPLDAGGGKVLLNIGQDNDHRIIGNGLNGWVNICPSTQTNMRSFANGTAANATCN